MGHDGRAILAKNMRALREHRGMTQEDVAGAAEIDRSYVSLIETRKFAASIDMLEKIASALGVGIHELLTPDLAMPASLKRQA